MYRFVHHVIDTTLPGRLYDQTALANLDGDGDIFTCGMEGIRGERPPRWYIWENLDGRGGQWQEHVILDANLGGHEAVAGDVTGNGLPDIVSKPWSPRTDDAVGGRMFVALAESVSQGE